MMWENIDSFSARLKVPNGWLVRYIIHVSSGASVAMIFVEDPNYSWKPNCSWKI